MICDSGEILSLCVFLSIKLSTSLEYLMELPVIKLAEIEKEVEKYSG